MAIIKVPVVGNPLLPENGGGPIVVEVLPEGIVLVEESVGGGEWNINPKTKHLLRGTSLRSNHEEGGRLDQFPKTNPVAWTNDYKGARVFFTTLGHPFDWKNDNMRRLTLNGIAWALGREGDIPAAGFDPTIIGTYSPNNSGFGEKFKQGILPKDF